MSDASLGVIVKRLESESELRLGQGEVGALASELAEIALGILRAAHQGAGGLLVYEEDKVLSTATMLHVVSYALRDLVRVVRDQKDKTSVAKYVGYFGFWFAKLKPIVQVWRVPRSSPPGEQADLIEVHDINERVALVLMNQLLILIARISSRENLPSVWQDCDIDSCKLRGGIKGLCFTKKTEQFAAIYNGRFKDYLAYSLRYRAGSPYMLINYLEQSIFFSCEHSCKPLFQDIQLERSTASDDGFSAATIIPLNSDLITSAPG